MDNPLTRLRQFIAGHYDQEEFRSLCFDLGVHYDELPGERLSARARELILYQGRRGQLEGLLKTVSRQRPANFDLDLAPAAIKALQEQLPSFEARDLQAEIAQFRQTLQGMTQLGLPVDEGQQRLAALEAQLKALGPVVQVAVGADLVLGEKSTAVDQRQQTVHGPQTNVLHAAGPVLSGVFHVYQSVPGPAPRLSEEQFQRALDDYLSWVWSEHRHARLHGLQSLLGSGSRRKPLSAVYTSLRVSHRPAVGPTLRPRYNGLAAKLRDGLDERLRGELAEPEQIELLDMADILTLGQRVAIVGGAGCGKTTYLSFVAASLAAALGGAELDTRLKPRRPDAPLPIPFLAPLRFWNVYRQAVAQKPGLLIDVHQAGSLKDFLIWYLRRYYGNYDTSQDFFERLLRGGGGLIMFDGLDEVVSRQERLVVRDAITRLLDRPPYQDNACLVTAREAGYRDAPFGDDFVRCDVQAMDEEQISGLVRAWCQDIPELQAAQERIAGVISELNQERQQRSQEPLVSTPLMVTMIVSVYYSKKELPRERARLYDAVTDVILHSQYSDADEAGARKLLVTWDEQLPADKQREWLSLLAFLMHQAGSQGALADEGRVRQLLTPALQERGELERLDAFMAQAEGRGGLFELRGEVFQFMHLTFQEYLAGQYLSSQWRVEEENLPLWAADGWWRVALLLAIGSLDHPRPFRERSDLVHCLLTLPGSGEARLAGAELAATGLLDLGQAEDALRQRASQRLAELLSDPGLDDASGPTRARAGRALGRLGDPRPGVGVDAETGLPDIAWCPVPAGAFTLGEGREEHVVKLPAYRISRYPVTNAQFAAFTAAGGYGERRYWTEAGWEWKEQRGLTGPREYGAPLNLPNHPVVGVSWYEALAFCRWLTWTWQERGLLAAEEAVYLPTEAQWERAARGADGHKYPWGDEFDVARCNVDETGIGATSAVGVFPDGVSPYGLLDMAGNVWEWTSSLRKGYPYRADDGREDVSATGDRVLRGGAWGSRADYARSASRYGVINPDYLYDIIGFRCVVAPSSSL